MMSRTWGVMVLGLALVGCTNDGGDEPYCGDGLCYAESAASCPADCSGSSPVCGDGVCNGSESLASCSRDCGSSACTESADNCVGETICITGTCVAAFPRVYRITNVSVSVPTTNSGSEWDFGAGAPDMYLSSGGVTLTSFVANQFSATFAGPFEFSLVAGQGLRLDVYDDDAPAAPDYVAGCDQDPITAAVLRSRTFDCVGGGISITSTIRPK